MITHWSNYISISRKILNGTPVIKGTRIPVQVIVGSLAGGMSKQEVSEQYRVSEKQILASLAYAAQVLDEEKVYALAH